MPEHSSQQPRSRGSRKRRRGAVLLVITTAAIALSLVVWTAAGSRSDKQLTAGESSPSSDLPSIRTPSSPAHAPTPTPAVTPSAKKLPRPASPRPTKATPSRLTGSPAGGPAASLGGCPNLPTGDIWHADVSQLPAHARSTQYVAAIGAQRSVKADFGAGQWDGGPIGIPITYVDSDQRRVQVTFDYASESDKGPYPIPADALVEGGPNSDGDRHVLVVDKSSCKLYELFDAHPRPDGSWHAGSGAIFDLRSHQLRPKSWTSADAAGLPVAAGLVRYAEVAAGHVDHAIRVTVPKSQLAFVWPARHAASSSTDKGLPPMGLRLRLKAGTDLSHLPSQARVVAQAMKTYGVVVADNGSPWFIGGAPDSRWNNDALQTLSSLRGSDFEAVDTSSLMASPDSGKVVGGHG